jgi:hypothetical protein
MGGSGNIYYHWFQPQNFSATIYQDTSNYQIQRDATIIPTATALPPSTKQILMAVSGWVELFNSGTVNTGQETPTTLNQIVIFHGPNSVVSGFTCQGCYVLEPAVDIQISVPNGDINGSDIIFRTGETYKYLIRGYLTSRTFEDFFMGSVPIFEVQYLERLK